jgi:hypothetical protein
MLVYKLAPKGFQASLAMLSSSQDKDVMVGPGDKEAQG